MAGLPGHVVPPNITPDPETGAGRWTDDMLARAIREGIGHDGHALFPFMPYPDFRYASDEDLASVIVYLRSIPPIRKALPQTEIIFPVKYLIRSVPQPITEPVPQPDVSTPVKRGEYLVTIAGCSGLPYATDEGPADSRPRIRRRLHPGRSVGPTGERQYHAGRLRHLVL